jgi:hypothetical protein
MSPDHDASRSFLYFLLSAFLFVIITFYYYLAISGIEIERRVNSCVSFIAYYVCSYNEEI